VERARKFGHNECMYVCMYYYYYVYICVYVCMYVLQLTCKNNFELNKVRRTVYLPAEAVWKMCRCCKDHKTVILQY
jgi:hypothetical protein